MLYFWMTLAACAMVAVDQLSKYLVTIHIPYGGVVPVLNGVFHLTYVRNTGAAFSMFSGQRWFFLLVTFAFLIFLGVAIYKRWFVHPLAGWAMTFLTGGAIGNLIDRILTGSVVDMFELEFIRFAIFNFADLFVTAGAIMFCLWVLFFDRRKKEEDLAS
mgnify:CR=1 FL=1